MTNLKATPKGLWEPWQTRPSALRFAMAHALAITLLWLLFARFNVQRLLHNSGLELALLWLTVLALHQAFWAARRIRVLQDPRLGMCLAVLLALCLSLFAAVDLAQDATPQWRRTFSDGRLLHPLNGMSLAGTLSLLSLPAWFVIADMRLSALDTTRDARLRAQPLNQAGQRPMSWRKRLFALVQWGDPVSIGSHLLQPYTLARVALRPLLDATVAMVVLSIFADAVINSGAIASVASAKAKLSDLKSTFPGGLWAFCLWLSFASSALVLALATRSAWIKHSYSACVSLVFAAHFGAAAIVVTLLTRLLTPGAPSWLKALFVLLNLVMALVVLMRLSKRSDQIDIAVRIQAEQATITAQAQRAAALSDLRTLQAQIEPHFLYNTLSNVQLLIRQDSSRADAMTGHLIDYLRARLPLMRVAHTPLGVELDLVRSYLEILKIRMGDRLSTTWAIPEACLPLPVLPLSVMSLVENAVKHGLEPKRGGGSIHISASLDKGWATVSIADTGVGFDAAQTNKSAGTGLGLSNLQERLRLSHPDALDASGTPARVSLAHNAPNGVVASIHWPIAKANLP